MSGEVYDHSSGTLSALDRQVVEHVPPGGNWRNLPDDFKSSRIVQIRRSAEAGEGSRSTYYGRLSPDRQSYTVSTYFNRPGNGCFIHPQAPRLISIREAARLQGFPDCYRFTGRGRTRFIQVGNAVPPLLAFQIARVLGPRRKFLDLFSGSGGLALGFEWAGHELIAAVDNDPACIATLVKNGVAPERALKRDLSMPDAVHTVAREVIDLNAANDVDVLIGGPPCQGFSTAGNNKADDPRNRLVDSFLYAVKELNPRLVIMENVPALTFRSRRSTLRKIIDSLRRQGYTVETVILHAEAYGLPQLRRRLFVQATLDGTPRWPSPHRQVIPPYHMSFQPGADRSRSRDAPPTVANAIGDLPQATVDDPEIPVHYVAEPVGSFQHWARGNLAVSELLPSTTPVSIANQPELDAALP